MSVFVHGAHSVEVNIYDDLTTNNPVIAAKSTEGLGKIEPTDWTSDGKPTKPRWLIPTDKVPGMEVSGYIKDARFVVRIPNKWNGKLVVCVAGGFASERSMDTNLSDYVLTRFDVNGASYAYACTDKGTRGEIIPTPDGKIFPDKREYTALLHPEDDLAKWHRATKELTLAVKNLLLHLKGRETVRTYITGGSNGGYVARYAIENDGGLYDGALDWKAVLWTPDVNNISVKVEQLRWWKIIKDRNASPDAKTKARAKLAFPPAADFLMEYYDSSKKLLPDALRMKFDPGYLHRDWWEYNQHPEDYDNYFWEERPREVKERVAKIALTGNIQKPSISIAGTWDVQIHPLYHAVGYRKLIERQGKGKMHRLYLIDRATHLDGLVGSPKVDPNNQMQVMLPYYHQAFDLLVNWVENGKNPPESKTVDIPTSKDKAINLVTGEETDKY